MLHYITEDHSLLSEVIWIQILQETLIKENLLLLCIYTCRRIYKVSKLQTIMVLSTIKAKYMAVTQLVKKLFGYKDCWRRSDINNKKFLYFVTIKVSCILQGTQPLILRRNTQGFSTTLAEKQWKMEVWIYKRSIPRRIQQIF